MSLRHDVQLASMLARPVLEALYTNIRIDLGAKVRPRRYPGIPETTFDPFDPVTAADPYPGYRELLAGPRVRYSPRRNIFLLSRYDDVRTAARSDKLLSNREGVTRTRSNVPVLLNMDDPRHHELRRKVHPAFARGALGRWQSGIDQLAAELVDRLLATPGADMVQDLAVPMPIRVIAAILGIPPEDEAFFRHWSNEAVRVADVEVTARGLSQVAPTLNGVRHLHDYFRSRFERGELLGSDALLGRLVANADGGELSRDELFFLALLLIMAGHETTTNLLSTMFLTLSENPEQFEAIRAGQETMLGGAIEEQLRYSSPIQVFYRTAASDYPVGDVVIPAGARVGLIWAAANRDPRRFDQPDAFIASRDPAHLAFGSGIHLCLGAGLARMEARAVLGELVRRVERIEVIGTPVWTRNASLRGLAKLHVALMPLRVRGVG